MTEKKSAFAAAKQEAKRLWQYVIKRDGVTSLKQRITREKLRRASSSNQYE